MRVWVSMNCTHEPTSTFMSAVCSSVKLLSTNRNAQIFEGDRIFVWCISSKNVRSLQNFSRKIYDFSPFCQGQSYKQIKEKSIVHYKTVEQKLF